jgi:hypothetical protein
LVQNCCFLTQTGKIATSALASEGWSCQNIHLDSSETGTRFGEQSQTETQELLKAITAKRITEYRAWQAEQGVARARWPTNVGAIQPRADGSEQRWKRSL